MPHVLIMSPFARDANSFYRGKGPWNYLAKQNRNTVRVSLANDDLGTQGVGWDTVDQFDMVYFHRPCREDDLTVLKIAKNLGVPTWVDCDDWLFDIPYWNPAAKQYSTPQIQNLMATCLATAEVVSVSTNALYEKIKAINPNTVILPNMYRSDLYAYRDKCPPPRHKRFAWRGSNTHDADLMSVASAFTKLSEPTIFFGGPTWMLLQQMDEAKIGVVPGGDLFLYMKQLYMTAPKVLLFPLVDCFFNRCKSNIAYQEALHAGALCVAPNLPEWRRQGVVTYEPDNPDSFLAAAESAMAMTPELHRDAVEDAFTHMKEIYGCQNINQAREKVLDQLLAGEIKQNTRDPFDPLVGMWALGQCTGRQTLPMGIREEVLRKSGIG